VRQLGLAIGFNEYSVTFETDSRALLTMPSYCGTLAAARCLGEAGVQVWAASEAGLAPASYSRLVSRRLRCPPVAEAERLLAWLLDLGARHPGAVLYPTSDDYAWFQTLHESALARHYKLYAPPCSVIEALLDKRGLHELCARVGIATPRSYYPDDDRDVARFAAEVPLPLLVKPRTQVSSLYGSKGRVVFRRDDVSRAYDEFMRENSYAQAVMDRMPHATRPFLQEYHPEGASSSYLVSGFVDRTGELFVARAADKIMQRPRTLGITLCAEAAPLDAALAEKIRALCALAGYFGVFQIEFLRVRGEFLLIDMNPRYYHYMAFDVARGMPLPLFAQLAACGDEASLAREVNRARACAGNGAGAFTYGLQFGELLVLQQLAGKMTREEAKGWWRWYGAHRHALVDAVREDGDGVPWFIDAALHLVHHVRHPRSFLLSIALDR
jgi:predicted ATP-grasp superfamily ATP-dependent carboligase